MTFDSPVAAPQWKTRFGFVAAALGSAVGLGNIWRFSYVVGENGGGAFVLVYALAAVVIGLPLLIGELALGRTTRADPVTAFQAVAPSRPWRWVGWLGVAASIGILAYYPIVTGWVLSYLLIQAAGVGAPDSGAIASELFGALLASPGTQLGAMASVTILCVAVVMAGVERGIERACKLAVPVFVVLLLALAAYGMSLPGARSALNFLFQPDWSALLRPRTYLAAVGQAFFSIGLAMAILVTHGAYLPRGTALPSAAMSIALGDTLIALVAGLVIFPGVFTYGFDPTHGAGLAFVVMPQVFAAMPGGWWAGLSFYVLLLLAALTSLIALLEVPVALLISRRGWRRRPAALAAGGCAIALGVPIVLGDEVAALLRPGVPSALELLDQMVSDVLLPLSGIAVALTIGWAWPSPQSRAASGLRGSRLPAIWMWLLRLPLPALIVLVMLGAFGLIRP
jgi:neurotransmitter:Na+ symporter, NSS family